MDVRSPKIWALALILLLQKGHSQITVSAQRLMIIFEMPVKRSSSVYVNRINKFILTLVLIILKRIGRILNLLWRGLIVSVKYAIIVFDRPWVEIIVKIFDINQ
jgi:hypothetical protein